MYRLYIYKQLLSIEGEKTTTTQLIELDFEVTYSKQENIRELFYTQFLLLRETH